MTTFEVPIPLLIENSLLLVELQDEDDCILDELYSQKKFYVWFLYKFGLYDEEEDSLMIWKLIKVNHKEAFIILLKIKWL